MAGVVVPFDRVVDIGHFRGYYAVQVRRLARLVDGFQEGAAVLFAPLHAKDHLRRRRGFDLVVGCKAAPLKREVAYAGFLGVIHGAGGQRGSQAGGFQCVANQAGELGRVAKGLALAVPNAPTGLHLENAP